MQIIKDGRLPLPESGNIDTLFERLLNYINLFDSDWQNRIQPASEQTINDFKEIVARNQFKHSIPEEYFIFLSRFGEQDGGLLTKPLPDTYIARANLNESYWDGIEFNPELIHSPYIVFLESPLNEYEFSFDLSSANTGQICITDEDELHATTSDTLEKLLFRCALQYFYLRYARGMRYFHPTNFSFYTFYINIHGDVDKVFPTPEHYLQYLRNLEKRYALHEVWFSNTDGEINNCYIAVDTSHTVLITCAYSNGALFGTISGLNKELVAEIKAFLSSSLYPVVKIGIRNLNCFNNTILARE